MTVPQNIPPEWRHPSGWWWDGHKWREPIPQLTRWQLIQQVPGALIKLIFLLLFFGLMMTFVVSSLSH